MSEDLFIRLLFSLGGAAPLVIAILLHKYRNRIAALKYTVYHFPVATSAEDPRFGSLKVTYNNEEVQNLWYSTILLRNESNQDVENLELNIKADDKSSIYASYGKNKESLNEFLFTDSLVKRIKSANTENEQKEIFNYLRQRRDYKIPSLNRGEEAEISLTISNAQNKMPEIIMTTDRKGVKAKFSRRPEQQLFGESVALGVLWGFILIGLCVVLLVSYIESKTLGIVLAATIGACSGLIGVLLMKGFRALGKLFD